MKHRFFTLHSVSGKYVCECGVFLAPRSIATEVIWDRMDEHRALAEKGFEELAVTPEDSFGSVPWGL